MFKIEFDIKWPEKGWYAVKKTNQPTNQPTFAKSLRIINFHFCIIGPYGIICATIKRV